MPCHYIPWIRNKAETGLLGLHKSLPAPISGTSHGQVPLQNRPVTGAESIGVEHLYDVTSSACSEC